MDDSIQAPAPVARPVAHSSPDAFPVTVTSRTAEQMEVSEGPTNESDDETQYPSGAKFAFIALALLTSLALLGLDLNILSTAVPSITDEFHTINDVGWYYSVYRLATCSLQFVYGKMYTVFSTKKIFISCLSIFMLGSLIAATARNSPMFIVGRTVAGAGSAGIISGVFVYFTYGVPLRKRPVWGAIGGMVEMSAALLGPVLGGILTQNLSWRWCFYINLPIGAIAILILVFTVSDTEMNETRRLPFSDKLKEMDLVGTALIIPSITTLLLAIQWGGVTYGWGNWRIILLFVFFVVLLSSFAYVQIRRGDKATLPPRIIGQRSIVSGMWFCFCCNSAISVVEYFLPIYFQGVKLKSAQNSGFLLLPAILGIMVSAGLAGPVTSFFGYYAPLMIVSSVLAPVGAGLMTTLGVATPLGQIIGYQVLFGFATGIGIQGPQIAAQTVLTKKDAPIGISAIMFAHNLGPSIFVSAAQSIFTNRLRADINNYAPSLNATQFGSTGLTDLANKIKSSGELDGLLLGYDKAVTQTYYLAVALTCLSLAGAVSIEWASVKKKRD